jgi:hypothetical protein
MPTSHTGEFTDEVRAAQTMLRDVRDDPKSSDDERTQAEALLELPSEELATHIERSQEARSRY